MPDIRGRCKQDLNRSKILAHHMQEHLAWIVEEYKDYPEFARPVETVLVGMVKVEDALTWLYESIP